MHYLEFAFRQSQNVNRIFVNKASWAPLENNATLWKTIGQEFPAEGGGSGYNSWNYALNQQVLLLGDAGANKGAQIVINSLDGMEHPWHLHGHEFQVCLHLILVGLYRLIVSFRGKDCRLGERYVRPRSLDHPMEPPQSHAEGYCFGPGSISCRSEVSRGQPGLMDFSLPCELSN
jgi:hypothetical protein